MTSYPNYLIPQLNLPRHCQNCKDTNEYSYNDSCIKGSCPVNSILIDSPTNGCLYCSPNTFFDSNLNTCVTKCPKFLVENTSTMTCNNCKTTNTYSLNEACVSKCPDDAIIVDTNRNGCEVCSAAGKVLENGRCVISRSKGKVLINNVCSICPESSSSIFNNSCVKECNDGYILDEFRICLACTNLVHNNQCVAACPNETATYPNVKECFN